MKVILVKKSFTMDEGDLIKQFKDEWQSSLDFETVKSCAIKAAERCGLEATELVQIESVELTKNRLRPTYWVNTIVRGYGFYAELSFDFVDAIQASSEDKIDTYRRVFKEEK